MLVLAILAALGAMSWPSISRTYESVRLKNAAEQVQAAFGHARVQAMTTGLPQVFHFEANSGNYSIDAWQDDSSATEASTASAATAPASPGSSSTGAITSTCAHQLPEGFVFAGAERVLDNRASMAESALSSSTDSSAPPILFYADGTTSEAQLTIANQYNRAVSVTLRGLTGVARMGEITTIAGTGGATP